MTFSLLFDDRSAVLLVRFEGDLTRKSIEAMIDAARDLALRRGPCDAIADFSSVTHVAVDPSYLRALGGRRRVMTGKRRIFVAPQPELFGLLRIYGQHQAAADEEPMVVHSRREAEVLLGLAVTDFRPLEYQQPGWPGSGGSVL